MTPFEVILLKEIEEKGDTGTMFIFKQKGVWAPKPEQFPRERTSGVRDITIALILFS